MAQAISKFLNLIKYRLQPESENKDLPESIEPEMVQKLMELAHLHDLVSVVGSVLVEQNLIPPGELYKQIQKSACKAAVQCENNIHELQWLRGILEESEIPYIPLKGSVVRDYYPEPWLRTSSDIDILVHEEDLDKAVSVLVEKGCQPYREKLVHEISLITPGRIHLELHFNLRENVASMDQVLNKVWEHSAPVAGKRYEYRQSNAFLMFHLIAHMAYHCYIGGSGIRSFVDIWLLRDRLDYDRQMLHQLCAEAELEKFYKHMMHLIDVWFCGKTHTPITRQLEQFVLQGGTFGSADNLILVEQAQTSKAKRLSKRVFLPYNGLKVLFPVLENKPWLTPMYQVVRWYRVITDGRLSKAIMELRIGRSHTDEQICEAKVFLDNLGLNFKQS